MPIVSGTFDVKMNPEPPSIDDDGVTIARATFDKTFHGPLSATGRVDFVSVRAGDDAAYVATLDGRAGSFVVTHRALAGAAGRTLAVDIVPGTGRGALVGLRGAITIDVIDRVHHYTFNYALD